MRVLYGWLTAAMALGMMAAASPSAVAQAPVSPEATKAPAAPPATASPAPGVDRSSDSGTKAAPTPPAAIPAPAVEKKSYTVPAGTKVLLELRSGINTRSARPGDGVYLASTFPVVVGNRVMIPAGVYVQGVVDRIVRAGRIHGRAQLDMHFTSIIFPNGTVVEIPGIVNSLPGAKDQSVKNDGEGTVEQAPDKGRNAGKTAQIAIPTGGTVGSIGGLGAGHPITGGIAGVGVGLATVGLVSLFTRGADVNIPSGTQVEMVLQRPLILEEQNLTAATPQGAAPPLVPAARQPKPMPKPHRIQILCPLGGLGCG